MTPDLERAALATANEHQSPTSTWPDVVAATLRALENLSPEVLEAMARAWWDAGEAKFTSDPMNQMSYIEVYEDIKISVRAEMLAAWRAGLNAILAAEGKDG